METDAEGVLHARLLMPPRNGVDFLEQLLASMADEVEARQGPAHSLWLLDRADPHNGAVLAQSLPLTADEPTWMEVGGGGLRVRRILEHLMQQTGTREVPIGASTPAWEERDLPPASGSVQLVDLPRARLEYSPLVQVLWDYAGTGGAHPLFRTPDTTVSAPTARFALNDGRFGWVRCTDEGLAEGVTGIGARWNDGRLEADGRELLERDPDLPGLRVVVLHPYDDPAGVGEVTGALVDRLSGGTEARFGLTEPALSPWDASLLRRLSQENSPATLTWSLSWPTGGGVLHVSPERRGVVEDLALMGETVSDLTDASLWEAVLPFAPTSVARTHGTRVLRAWAHQSLASRFLRGRGATDDAPAGYVSVSHNS